MDVLADQVTSLNTHRDTQTQLVKKLEEREKALQNAVVRFVFLILCDKFRDHTHAFLFRTGYFLMRFLPSSTPKCPKMSMETEAFENGFESGAA